MPPCAPPRGWLSRPRGCAPVSGRPAHGGGDGCGDARCRHSGGGVRLGDRGPALRIPRTRRESVSVVEFINDRAQLPAVGKETAQWQLTLRSTRFTTSTTG